ncbi:HNH endonuclease [Arthrobacter sp. MPF02]|uniref:HNH endonuclease signature motif containing protein n=1 Tax=Arthrobacter sp. MPF02 TaxID=3388492 RepID=UPI00398481CE
MGSSAGTRTGMEAIHATVAALAALDAEDAALASGSSGAVAGDGVDVLRRAYEIRLERMGLEKKLEAQAAARRALSVAEAMDLQHAMIPPDAPLHDRTYTEISTVEEIAGILTISPGAASAFVDQSRQVCALPPVMDALSVGTLSWQQARIFADETESLDHAASAALVEHFLDPETSNRARGCPATGLVPARLRARLRGWRERHHPESIEKRHRKSVADRRVEFTPDRDGMAWISAYLPADMALAISNDLTATARSLQGPNEPRTLTQLKTDDFTRRLLTRRTANTTVPATVSCQGEGDAQEDLIGLATFVGSDEPVTNLGSFEVSASYSDHSDHVEPLSGTITNPDAGKVPTPRAEVLVTVPVFALLGLTDEPADLDGYGPIPASTARKLLTGGAESFRRVLLDPSDGTPLEIGRTSYRLTKAMKKALQLRDGKCTFPGCNNNALDNEADHLTAWQHGGTTGISNLAQLCPKHHRLKHNSGWTPTSATKHEPPGWTSPTGRRYQAEQPDREPPQWPPGITSTGVGFPLRDPLEGLNRLPWWEDDECAITDADIPDVEVPDDASDLECDLSQDHYPEWAVVFELNNSRSLVPRPQP